MGYNRNGSKNPNWKGGKGVCETCGRPKWNRAARRCKACYVASLRERKGSANPEWDNFTSTSKQQGRDRATRRFKLGPCNICGKPARDRHHLDNNPLNNASTNIQTLCRRCHMQVDGRLTKFNPHTTQQ